MSKKDNDPDPDDHITELLGVIFSPILIVACIIFVYKVNNLLKAQK